jgi:hypothetical protein
LYLKSPDFKDRLLDDPEADIIDLMGLCSSTAKIPGDNPPRDISKMGRVDEHITIEYLAIAAMVQMGTIVGFLAG